MGIVSAWSRALGALCLIVLLACSSPPGALAQAAGSDEDLWQTVKSSGERDLLDAFIAAFPQSKYIAEARAMLAALKPASPANPPPPTTQPPPVVTAPPPASTTTSTPSRPEATFDQPRQGAQASMSMRVDACLGWGRDCGKPAADAFCQGQGFAAANSFSTRVTGGPTWMMADQQICAMARCAALIDVVCEGDRKPPAPLPQVTIESPRVNNLPLANCLYPQRSCGQESAEAYCDAAGYANARRFDGSLDGTRSIHLGDRSVCEGPQCRALTRIVCSQ